MVKTEDKNLLVESLKSKVFEMRASLLVEIERLVEDEKRISELYKKAFGIEQEMIMQEWVYTKKRIVQLTELQESPFFAKVLYKDDGQTKEVYISKYEYIGNGVSSWIAPIATLRFEELGQCEFVIETKKSKQVDLCQKDSYVISKEKIIYYSQEDKEDGVQIIYEDFLSNVKSEFGLSEIVSKIEKEQYKIIQSDPKSELIISGPAGSGKTTICLHRVAYLLQTPETSDRYAGKQMIMFVQDKGTKDYFSSILPKLGIPNMLVTTYFEWGALTLELDEVKEIGVAEADEKYLEYLEAKVNILGKGKIPFKKFGKSFIFELDKLYKKHLSEKNYSVFSENSAKFLYDYVDITIMLAMMIFENRLCVEDEFHKSLGNGKYKRYLRKIKVEYSMVIVDEFQNYSYDQISLLKNCIPENNKSIVYIGDINQKSLLKPETKESTSHFRDCTKVELSKVYRNTKQILEFIKSEGYVVEIPEKVKEGASVEKSTVLNSQELFDKVEEILRALKSDETIGILCDRVAVKNTLALRIATHEKLKIMTKLESQGTEFNSVICINELGRTSGYSERFKKVVESTQRNADYIGYTRAVEKLIVFLV